MENENRRRQQREIDIIPTAQTPASAKKASLKTRTITAIVLLAILLPTAFLGDWFLFALVAFFLIVAIWEIIRCGKLKYNVFTYIITFLMAIMMIMSPIFKGLVSDDISPRIFANFIDINLSPLIIFLAVSLLFLAVIVDKNFTIQDACFLFTMMIIICFGLQSILYVRYYPTYIYHLNSSNDNISYFNWYDNFYSSFLLIFVAISGILSDTGGYFFGMLFGKNKMNERISPKKTWEGFAGGIALSFFICSLIGLLIPLLSNGELSLLDGVLDLEHWYNILILSLLLPSISVLGDFVFSSIKRFNGIKDFGKIFPGHGGVLDRIDSLLFAAMAAATYISFYVEVFGN